MNRWGTVAVGTLSLIVLTILPSWAQDVSEKVLLENDAVRVSELTFPPGFKGPAHPAAADEMAYVLEGEFTVVAIPAGKRLLKPGEVDWTEKGTIHSSRNETKAPVRILAVIFKKR
jgi:quercetin dioxygenase-like cupin family protein